MQGLNWHGHSIAFQALILVLNSARLFYCLIGNGGLRRNCGRLIQAVSIVSKR